MKSEWRGESVGFFDGDTLTGVGLILYRQLPKLKRFLAYLPEGPVLDWARPDITAHLAALIAHAKRNKAFAVRMGPTIVHRSWGPATIKAAIADEAVTRLSEVTPDDISNVATRLRNQLLHEGWQTDETGHGFAAGQPQVEIDHVIADHLHLARPAIKRDRLRQYLRPRPGQHRRPADDPRD